MSARKRRKGLTKVLMVRVQPKHLTMLRGMARRAGIPDAALVRRLIEVHYKVHGEIARAAERIDAEAKERTLAAIAEVATTAAVDHARAA
jgi:hypothetical protein